MRLGSKYGIPLCATGLVVAIALPAQAAAVDEPFEASLATSLAGVEVDGQLIAPQVPGGIVQRSARVDAGGYANIAASAEAAGDPLPELALAASSSGVQLTWNPVDGAKTYEITRDGKPLTTTADLTWTDRGATKGKTAQYQVQALTPIDPSFRGGRFETIKAVNEGPAYREDPNMVPSRAKDPSTYAVTVTRSVTVPTADNKAAVDRAVAVDKANNYTSPQSRTAASTAANSTQGLSAAAAIPAGPTSVMRHTAFIPPAKVPAGGCQPLDTNGQFGGDNRSFSVSSERYRMRLNLYFYWDKNQIGAGRNVKPTTYYPSNGGPAQSRTAAFNGSEKRWYPAGYPGYTHFWVQVNSASTNAFCETTGPAINFEWDVRVDESKAWAIAGVHDAAPSHEIYYGTSWVKDGDRAGWVAVHKWAFTSGNFLCLGGQAICRRIRIEGGTGSPYV